MILWSSPPQTISLIHVRWVLQASGISVVFQDVAESPSPTGAQLRAMRMEVHHTYLHVSSHLWVCLWLSGSINA